MTRRGVPLVLVGAVVEVPDADLAAHREKCEYGVYCSHDQAVAVYLGDQELTRITGDDLVVHDGDIIIDETVAGWLSRMIGKLT